MIRLNEIEERKDKHMDAYTSFASVYDTFMDNIPYEEWAEYLRDLLKEYRICDGIVLLRNLYSR